MSIPENRFLGTERSTQHIDIPSSSFVRLRLKVQEGNGRISWREVTNQSETEAIRAFAARGARVLAIESGLIDAQQVVHLNLTGKFPLLLFSQELLALLDAGLHLNEALNALHAKERQTEVRNILNIVLHMLGQGKNFSDVLATMPQYFPEVYVATIRASERTGDLSQSLTRYIAYQIQFEMIRKKLVSAAVYPAMLLTVGCLVTLFLIGYVVPRFSAVYESSGREVPWMSSILLSFGKLIYGNWQIALGSLSAMTVALFWGIAQPQGREWLLSQVLRLPWLRTKVDEFRLARFYRATALLLASGIALPRAMGMVTGLLGKHQQTSLAQCRLAVERGQSLSVALVGASLASPIAESLIKVGERSGQMADMLERTARFVDEDFARWVDWASRLLEPILMMVIGVVIGGVVVLMYMPIFELAGSL